MAESKTEKKEQEEKPASEAQTRLIKQLQEETGCQWLPEEYQKKKLSREEASNCIHLLKETKVRDQALRSANNNVPSFDKIVHAMLYKLYITEEDRRYFVHRCLELGEIGAMCEVYDSFKKCEAGVRKHVKESGKR